jgi:hypothetical protein
LKKFDIRNRLIVAVGFAACAIAAKGFAQQKQSTDKPDGDSQAAVRLLLTISVEEYDPNSPSQGRVKCVLVNQSKSPVDVPVGYDGREIRLSGKGGVQVWASVLHPSRWRPGKGGGAGPITAESFALPEKPVVRRVEPGSEQVVFDLSLDEILFQGESGGNERKWYWQAPTRSMGPRSPILIYGKRGFLDQTRFSASVTIGDHDLSSEQVTLKVKSHDAESK